ncbi:MAG: hypothetical protein CVV64_01645 [Candidatus Wallbacteria bacterium HGW-Wallbacteria-1]|jgi:heptosyltransferase-2|uniref:Lipopolysaccharide heptosyltransferase II n=1 Tax=Candidatus Wallbacteria bacterium HGW-Wallbacteria-1 TaxID=2013854 RepID=A0A2N1PV16_9BACT|nr:MAG: hypothetical protein CVV64_01645 [Candidatus Wallbacteria bacterium HGW-Wallbacteria-1]
MIPSRPPLRILVIRLRYIGDVVLTVPFLRELRKGCSSAHITLMTGPAAFPVIQGCPYVDDIIIYDKKNRHSSLASRLGFIRELRSLNFDVSFVLQRSFSSAFYAYASGIPLRVGFDTEGRGFMLNRRVFYDKNQYESDAFMENLRIIGLGHDDNTLGTFEKAPAGSGVATYVKNLVQRSQFGISRGYAVINPGPDGSPKSWYSSGFAELAAMLINKLGLDVAITWGPGEKAAAEAIYNLLDLSGRGEGPSLSLAPATDIPELILLLKSSRIMITTDTGPLHMAAANNIPTVTIFGPTNPVKWSPRDSEIHGWVKEFLPCWPCDYNRCSRDWQCMKMITADKVFSKVRQILDGRVQRDDIGAGHRVINFRAFQRFEDRRNILVIETSSVGEVVLISPALRALRGAFPNARITALVIPGTRGVIEGLDTIDEIICYDKFGKHRNFTEALEFIRGLRKRNFDLVLLFHRSFRSAVVSFFTGARDRVGVSTQGRGFLVNETVPNRGNPFQHEIERNNDIIRSLGIEPLSNRLEFHIPDSANEFARQILEDNSVTDGRLGGLYPGAGWPSKRWRGTNFAALGREMIRQGLCEKIVVLWGPGEEELARGIAIEIGENGFIPPATSLKELGALIRSCSVLVTNDTGPMHMASAIMAPQVVLMGPTHPRRWGPMMGPSRILFSGENCGPCNRRECDSCICMDSISVESCIAAARELLIESGGIR